MTDFNAFLDAVPYDQDFLVWDKDVERWRVMYKNKTDACGHTVVSMDDRLVKENYLAGFREETINTSEPYNDDRFKQPKRLKSLQGWE